jgi:hypothetical protein
MASFTATVTKRAELEAVPEDAKTKPHHVVSKNGSLSGFKNPYPSYGEGVGPLILLKRAIK